MKFRDIISSLESEGRLMRIKEEKSPEYEIPSLLKRNDGKPMIFENVKGSSMPVVGNLMSSMDLLCKSVNTTKDGWIDRISSAIRSPGKIEEAAGNFDYLEPDLNMLPILTHYPNDMGAYITSGVVFAQRNGSKNVSFHRLARISSDRLVGRLVEKRDLHTMYIDAKEHGEDVDVSISIGNSAGVLVAAATSVERGVYELGIASALENGISIVKAKTNSSEYPTDSEIVIEAKILHDEVAKEGPFVDLTNTYDIVREQPVFAVDRIAVKRDPIYHALLPGGNEHKLLMGAPRTPTIYMALRDAGIDVKGVYLTEGGSGWLDAVIAIRKKSDDEPKVAIDAAIKGHKSLKKITIVDDDIDITDPNDVNYAVTMYWAAGKELVLNNVKGSSLDPMAAPDGTGSKLCIDATRPVNVPKEKELKMKKASIDF